MQELTDERLSPVREEEAFHELLEHAGLGVAQLSLDGEWLAINHRLCDILGYSHPELLYTPVQQVMRFEDIRAELEECRKLLEGAIQSFVTQKKHLRPDGQVAWLKATVTLLRDCDGEPHSYLALVEDVTAPKRALQQLLSDGEKRLDSVANSAPVMMWLAEAEQGHTAFNRGWLEFRGRSAEQERGEGWLAGVHPSDRQRRLATARAAYGERRRFTVEYRLRRHDGEYRWVRDSGAPHFLPDGSFVGYVGCCIDIDDRKQSQLARRKLSWRLLNAQEAERARIGRELHDGIGQKLALLNIQLQRACQPAPPGKKRPGIQELSEKLKEIGQQVSRLSHQLHSSELEYLGVAVAVRGLCREFSQQYSIQVGCQCTDIPADLDKTVGLCLLRVVQEALHNVAKHSRATAVTVELACGGNQVQVTIADNGIGFESGKVWQTAGLGLVSMRERMHLVGGRLAITSAPGEGTRVEGSIPLAKADAGRHPAQEANKATQPVDNPSASLPAEDAIP